jgi:uncharacterized protein YqgC (DUF456 family)
MTMVWVYYLLLLVVLVAGWLINVVTLPGLWLMTGALAAYGWWTGWNVYVGWTSVIILLILSGLAELVELGAGAAGSKVAGARRRGMIGAIIGGIIGAIFFTGIVPIPIVGTIIGVCFGTFLGAAAAELSDRSIARSMFIGAGAAGGRLAGILAKLGVGFLMLIVALIAAFPVGGTKAATAAAPRSSIAPTTNSTTAPATIPTSLP